MPPIRHICITLLILINSCFIYLVNSQQNYKRTARLINDPDAPFAYPCPVHYAVKGDRVLFYQENEEHGRSLLGSIELTSLIPPAHIKFPEVHISASSKLCCAIERQSLSGPTIISRTEIKFSHLDGFTKFVYDPRKTVYRNAHFGQKVILSCPYNGEDNNSSLHTIVWFRLPGFQIQLPTNQSDLKFDKLAQSDLGVYYCAQSPPKQRTSTHILPVVKFQLTTVGHSPAQPYVETVGENVYQCGDSVAPLMQYITWEAPAGTILIGQYGNTLIQPNDQINKSTIFCSYETNNLQHAVSNTKTIALRRVRRNVEENSSGKVLIHMAPRTNLENLTLGIRCTWYRSEPKEENVIYIWKIGDKVLPQRSPLLQQQPLRHGKLDGINTTLTCIAKSSDTNQTLGSTWIDLMPISVQSQHTVILEESPKKIYSYHPGDSVQLDCDVLQQLEGKDVVWTLNDSPLPASAFRYDKLSTSIVVLKELLEEHEGTYKCYQGANGDTMTQAYLFKLPSMLTLAVNPLEETRWANSNQAVEFHCHLTGRENGNQLTEWYFLPTGSDKEIRPYDDVDVDRPSLISELTFLTISNVQKYHEGEYICKALNMTASGTLKVLGRDLSVTPKEVDARPGTTVSFMCELSAANGIGGAKLYWMRADRQDLRPGKEEVIGSNSGRLLLIVKSVDWADHNTSYICTDGVSYGNATLYVREDCGPGYKSCNSRECIFANLFCDGKEDCQDGSDELLEKCHECAPHEYACKPYKGKTPIRNCYSKFWHCDGEDDCGNKFDESSCPPPSLNNRCNGTHFTCPADGKIIARGYMCDRTPDCEDGADEEGCSTPVIVEPIKGTQLIGRESENLTLTCKVYGRPPPAITWRFNWGHFREGVEHIIETIVIDCDNVMSYLTLVNLKPEASGLYTCEAINRERTLAPDISVNVAKTGICKPPKFNDAAWFEGSCLTCYCSNVTERCRSAQGYTKSHVDRKWELKEQGATIRTYAGFTVSETRENILYTDNSIRIRQLSGGRMFLEGAYGLKGSWLSSYGQNLKIGVRLYGPPKYFIPGALIALHSDDFALYWCSPKGRVPFYSISSGYDNLVSLRLTERDHWFLDANCTLSLNTDPGRRTFMRLLRNVQRIGIRVRNYADQHTMELYSIGLEQVVPTDRSDRWIPEVEQCFCPIGYEGLSCETCAYGYEKHPTVSGQCRKRCGCDECDSDGKCQTCSGNRDGPLCQQCKPGFYRPMESKLNEDCVPCKKCEQESPHVIEDCIGTYFPNDAPVCKCPTNVSINLLPPECDRCTMAKLLDLPPSEDAICGDRPEPSSCNHAGTEYVDEQGKCICKKDYTGENCDECSEGYFKYNQRCLRCYCAGKTTSCKLSSEHYFLNVTAANNANHGIELDVWLAQRTKEGGLEKIGPTIDGKLRVYQTSDAYTIQHPLTNSGVTHFELDITSSNPDYNSHKGLPIYRNLYGGLMTFRLDSRFVDPALVTQGQRNVLVELESARFGRVWTTASYASSKQRYEVRFAEDWWAGGWHVDNTGQLDAFGSLQRLNRGQLMRVLATTTSVAIATGTGNSEGLKGMRLSGLTFQLSAPNSIPGISLENSNLAPVEICDCPQATQSDEREQSPSCEGCRDSKQVSVVRLAPLGDDLICGGCSGPECDECPRGQFKYNVYTGEKYPTCQMGLTIDKGQRRILAQPGQSINLVCRATSYRGGVVVHEWKPHSKSPTAERVKLLRHPIPTKRTLLGGRLRIQNESIHRSEVIYHLDNVQISDAGEYKCLVSSVGVSMEELFYLDVVGESTEAPSIPENDTLNIHYFIPTPRPRISPSLSIYKLEHYSINQSVTVVKGTVHNPKDLTYYHLTWLYPNRTAVPVQHTFLNNKTGEFVIYLTVPHSDLESRNETINGFFVGKDPILHPLWLPMDDPKILEIRKDNVMATDIIIPPSNVTLRFMQPHTIRVHVKTGKDKVRVQWKRIGPLPETIEIEQFDSEELPDGMEQDKSELIIWAAAKDHEGIYEGVVIRDNDDSELTRFNITIHVDPLHPGGSKQLNPGEAIDIPEKPVTPSPEGTVWDFLIQGFTPEAEYCEHPKWTLVDYQLKTTMDITDKVRRVSQTSFRVEYPLTSGVYLQFQCQPVPRSSLTGQINFNITSNDPRIVFYEVYENPNSTFPTRLVCLDLNPQHPSKLKITSEVMEQYKIEYALVKSETTPVYTDMGLQIRKVELDWRRVGQFDPFSDAGQFTCVVENAVISGSKTITVPMSNITTDIPKDPYSRVYIYSPDTYVTPEQDGLANITVKEGSKLRIYCNYDSRPAENFHGWKSEADEVNSQLNFTHKTYSSLVITESAILTLNGQIIECSFDGQSKKIRLLVIPKGQPGLLVKITSDSLVDNRLIAVAGGNMNLTCEIQHLSSKPIEIRQFDWYVQFSGGMRKDARRIQLSKQVESSENGNWIQFNGIRRKPFGTHIFCVARPKDTYTAFRAYHPSPMVELWVRKPKLSAHIDPVTRPGVISHIERRSIRLKCIGTDLWHNKRVQNPRVKWNMKTYATNSSQNDILVPIPSKHHVPWLGKALVDNMLLLGSLERRDNLKTYVQCELTDNETDATVKSEWILIEFVPKEIGQREPKLRINYETLSIYPFYPAKVECVDENSFHQSVVTWSRQNGQIEPANVETKSNYAKVTWTHGGEDRFDPQTDADSYICRATNEYDTAKLQLYFPSDLMQPNVSIDESRLEISSSTHKLFEKDGKNHIRVVQGKPFELLCTFYGYPAPARGLRWTLYKGNKGRNLNWMARHGLRVRSGRFYWTNVNSPSFDATGRQAGIYECAALANGDIPFKREEIVVELYPIYVKVEELDQTGLIRGNEGTNGTMTCGAYDGYSNAVVPNATYHWAFETFSGDTVDFSSIASDVRIDGNTVHYWGLREEATKVRVRCVTTIDLARYTSPNFGFRVVGARTVKDRRSDIEPGATLWISGYGVHRVLLLVSDVNNQTNQLNLTEGEQLNLTCVAVDSVTNQPYTGGHFNFGWRVRNPNGQLTSFSELAWSTAKMYASISSDTGILELEQLKPSSDPLKPAVEIECLATSLTEPITYVSKPVKVIIYQKGVTPNMKESIDSLILHNRLQVEVEGLSKTGTLAAVEGSEKLLICKAIDHHTGAPPVGQLNFSWEFTGVDGMSVSTGQLIDKGQANIDMNENQISLSGLKQTGSIYGRCRITWASDVTKDADKGRITYYSKYFRFDVTDANGTRFRDYDIRKLAQSDLDTSELIVDVTGLNQTYGFTGQIGGNVDLKCRLLNATTNLTVDETTNPDLLISYGWEFLRPDGLGASSDDLASRASSNQKTGQLHLENLREQSMEGRVLLRCSAYLTNLGDDPYKKYTTVLTGSYIFVNVPPVDQMLSEFTDYKRKQYEISIRGLDKNGMLELRHNRETTLECIVRDIETDTLIDTFQANQKFVWQIPVYPSGFVANPADVAKTINVDQNRLTLNQARSDLMDGLRGRCIYYSGFAYYASSYFTLLVPRSVSDGRVFVDVQDVSAGEYDMKYVCTAYDTKTGARLDNVSYEWIFTTNTGEHVLPVYLFKSVNTLGSLLDLDRRHHVPQLPENIRRNLPIQGYCMVYAKQYTDGQAAPHLIKIYRSRPFIQINPESNDLTLVIVHPDPRLKAERILVMVQGVKNGLVTVPENGTVTLTCEARDTKTMRLADNLTYIWELQKRDGSPADTASLVRDAVLLKQAGGQQLTLVGVTAKAVGLQGRCLVRNDTQITTELGVLDTPLVPPGEQRASPFFEFDVTKVLTEPAFSGHKDYEVDEDQTRYQVILSGLDKYSRLVAVRGSNVTLEVKLRDAKTNEILSIASDPLTAHMGLEVRYDNGHSASLSELAESATVNAQDGIISLSNFQGSTKPTLQLRVVLERRELSVDPTGRKTPVRLASEYINVISLGKGEEDKIVPPVMEFQKNIYPVVDGLNQCGYVPHKLGSNITLHCRPNDTRVSTEKLLFDWDIRHLLGQTIPSVGLVAGKIMREHNRLHLINLRDPRIPLIGRCLIAQTENGGHWFSSLYFGLGSNGPGCGPDDPLIIPDPSIKQPQRITVLVRIIGLGKDGQVIAKPEENYTLKCVALNLTTNEAVPDSAIGWEFMNDRDELLHGAQLASRYQMTEDNELRLFDLRENRNVVGRCVVTLDRRVTLSSPYFRFHVYDGPDQDPGPVDGLIHGDRRVRVEVSGLKKQNQISINRAGDDAALRCQAVIIATSTPLYQAHGVRYGWDMRYLDEDPVSTTDVAVVVEAKGENLDIRGVRAQQNARGRNYKGRCVVFVPANLIDPTISAEHSFFYGSAYFMVDVVKKPTTLDPEIFPIPGKHTDGISIKIIGLDENGHLTANEGDDRAVVCEAFNTTTNQTLDTGRPSESYNVFYGFEFTDVNGRSIDSSRLANSVLSDANGNLRLHGLVAPKSGDLPHKVRCMAIVGKRSETPARVASKSRSYQSHFFALNVKRIDGSSTLDPDTEKELPDIAGTRFRVYVTGIRLDNSLTASPGQNINLTCLVQDTKTGELVSNFVYGWEFRRPIGAVLNRGLLAHGMVEVENRLELKQLKPFSGTNDKAFGRCVVHRGRQIYKSDYFKVQIREIPKGRDVEGDGRILVRVDGADQQAWRIRLPQETMQNFTCIATDAQTEEPIPNMQYSWEFQVQPEQQAPKLRGSLGHRASMITEGVNGQLTITSSSENVLNEETRLRCRVWNDSVIYTSPFYKLDIQAKDKPEPTVDPVIYSKYRVHIDGLDKRNRLNRNIGDIATLVCNAYDARTGEPATSVRYRWHLKRTDGESLSGGDLVVNSFRSDENMLILDGLRLTRGTVKGQCEVSNNTGIAATWDSSPWFHIYVPPENSSITKSLLETQPHPVGPGEARTIDDRVLVTVTGLDNDENLIRKMNSTVQLNCKAEVKQGVEGTIVSYGWEFRDGYGSPFPIGQVARSVHVTSANGTLQLDGLEETHPTKLKGSCITLVLMTDNKKNVDESVVPMQTEILYRSKYFAVSITEDGSAVDKAGGKDVQGSNIAVTVEALDPDGSLKAETGDIIELRCIATDTSTSTTISDVIYSWDLIDRFGHPVPVDQLAQNVHRLGDRLKLVHLQPTEDKDFDQATFGRCLVYSPDNKHVYRSEYFRFNIHQSDLNGSTGQDDRIEVKVKGLSNGFAIAANEGDTVTLECVAYEKNGETEAKSVLSRTDAIYHFQFMEAVSDNENVYGGHIADEIKQERLPDGGIKLTLVGVSAGGWHRGRCIVLFVPGGQSIEGERELTEPVRQYNSIHFWSDIHGKEEQPSSATEIINRAVTIRGLSFDQKMLVKVPEAEPNGTIILTPGSRQTLHCYLIDTETGKKVTGVQHMWEIRSLDDLPLASQKLADLIETTDAARLEIIGYRSTGENAKIRCLVRIDNDTIPGQEYYRIYGSPLYSIRNNRSLESISGPMPDRRRYDPDQLRLEIVGLNPDGTLPLSEDGSAKLNCQVVDKPTGQIIYDDFKIGWNLGTGPDGRPVPLNTIAHSVKIEGSKLQLQGLRSTSPHSGGLRRSCVLTLDVNQLKQPKKYGNLSVDIVSESFVIHVKPISDKSIQKWLKESRSDTPYINWIPGTDPKNAVIVKVLDLYRDGSVRVHPGENLTLSCIALDRVNLRRIVPTSDVNQSFTWEIRRHAGGELLKYGALANGYVVIKDSDGTSNLHMTNLRYPYAEDDSEVVGRCTVRLGRQVFHSNYFPIRIQGSKEIENYLIAPEDYWSADQDVVLVVKGLDRKNSKSLSEGSNLKLKCEAIDAKTHEKLPDARVVYGWQMFNPERDVLMTPLAHNGTVSGQLLDLQMLQLPEARKTQLTLWGWCAADVNQPEDEPAKRYRSSIFKLVTLPKEQLDVKIDDLKDDLFVRVNGLTKPGYLQATEGDSREIWCEIIDTASGHPVKLNEVYGWDWRNLDGSLADLSSFTQQMSSEGNRLHIQGVMLTYPMKGRCAVTIRPTLSNRTTKDRLTSKFQCPVTYRSDFFFLDTDSIDPMKKWSKSKRRLVKDMPGVNVSLKDEPSTGVLTLTVDEDYELTVNMDESSVDESKKISMGYQLVYQSGEAAHSGEISRGMSFDTKTGLMKLEKVQFPTKPVKIRFYVLVNASDHEANMTESEKRDREEQPVQRYWSNYYPIEVKPKEGEQHPVWIKDSYPNYDVAEDKYNVKISGLDYNEEAAALPNEDLTLTCSVVDKQAGEVSLNANAFVWQIIDSQGNPANPGNLADKVELVGGRTMKLTGYRSTASSHELRGRCVVNVPVPVPVGTELTPELPPTQKYRSAYFKFTLKEKEEKHDTNVTTAFPVTTATTSQDVGLELILESPHNPMFKTSNDAQVVLARLQRKFMLKCRINVSDPSKISKGLFQPRLMWYYRQPVILGDVPIPSELFPVYPPLMETLRITPQISNEITIQSDAYSFRDDMAEFHCMVFGEVSNRSLAQKVVFIQEIKEKYDIRVFDEDLRNRAFNFVGSNKTLTCYVDDVATGKRVDSLGYQWEVTDMNLRGNTLRQSGLHQPAGKTEGWNSNQLHLVGLTLPLNSTRTEITYEFRCIFEYNETFDTISRPFLMNLMEKPNINFIQFEREKPQLADLGYLGDAIEDSYEATEDYRLKCKPSAGDFPVTATWYKCLNEDCTQVENLLPIGDTLFLFANSTRFTDEGRYRCQVTLYLEDYNYKNIQSKDIILKRKAAPAIYSSDAINYTINDEMSLRCTDESSSPESEIQWTFQPTGTQPPERKDPIVLGKPYVYGRIYIFAVARGQLMPEHSGTYTCTATNAFGTANSTINVIVSEDFQKNTFKIRRIKREEETHF